MKPIVLRGHHLLCFLGFRGLGYSPSFVEKMKGIDLILKTNLEAIIEVVARADELCLSCPFGTSGKCLKEGQEAEERTRQRDLMLLQALGKEEGSCLTVQEIHDLLSRHISEEVMATICQGCQWQGLGYCLEGLKALKGGREPF